MDRTVLIDDLASRIAGIRLTHAVRVAIDGVDAAGKTILADELAERVGAHGRFAVRASIDDFHNPASERRRRGEFSPEGYYRDSFDFAAVLDSVLRPLGPEGDGVCRLAAFDFRTDTRIDSPPVNVPPDAVLVFDGVFLLRPELRRYWDFSVFVRADFEVTVARAEQRDRYLFGSAGGVRERYVRRYVPGQQLYFSEATPESHASVIVDNNDPGHPAYVLPV
jgi:uridine kinase